MRLNEIEKRLQIPPRHTVLRVNNITISTKDAVEKAEKALAEVRHPFPSISLITIEHSYFRSPNRTTSEFTFIPRYLRP